MSFWCSGFVTHICNVIVIFIPIHVKYVYSDMGVNTWYTCMHTYKDVFICTLIHAYIHRHTDAHVWLHAVTQT